MNPYLAVKCDTTGVWLHVTNCTYTGKRLKLPTVRSAVEVSRKATQSQRMRLQVIKWLQLSRWKFFMTVRNSAVLSVLSVSRNKKFIRSVELGSLSNATFSFFDHVMFIQFKICCCVQNFMKIGRFFTEIWRYIDFKNGGRPPSWNCFTTIRDHPRSLCCWPQLYLSNFMSIWYTDLKK